MTYSSSSRVTMSLWRYIQLTKRTRMQSGHRHAAVAGFRLVCLVLAIACCGCDDSPSPQSLPQVAITIGGKQLLVEVARTKEQRALGMMFRKDIGPDEGMLFVFPQAKKLSFFMKNTHVPLSIAFIRMDGVIDRITGMAPQTETEHISRTSCLYALEMPQGWFAEHGVLAGAKLTLPPDLKAAAE